MSRFHTEPSAIISYTMFDLWPLSTLQSDMLRYILLTYQAEMKRITYSFVPQANQLFYHTPDFRFNPKYMCYGFAMVLLAMSILSIDKWLIFRPLPRLRVKPYIYTVHIQEYGWVRKRKIVRRNGYISTDRLEIYCDWLGIGWKKRTSTRVN